MTTYEFWQVFANWRWCLSWQNWSGAPCIWQASS